MGKKTLVISEHLHSRCGNLSIGSRCHYQIHSLRLSTLDPHSAAIHTVASAQAQGDTLQTPRFLLGESQSLPGLNRAAVSCVLSPSAHPPLSSATINHGSELYGWSRSHGFLKSTVNKLTCDFRFWSVFTLLRYPFPALPPNPDFPCKS